MAVYYNENDPRMAAWLEEAIKMKLIAPGVVDNRSIKDVQAVDLKTFSQWHLFAGTGAWSYALQQAGWPDERQVLTGSCPCIPFSVAGNQKGLGDPRHLWPDMFRLIRGLRPDTIFGEQVASKESMYWLDLVASDLEAANYAAAAMDLSAASIGAYHQRSRLFWVAERLANANEPKSARSFASSRSQGNAADGREGFAKSSGSPPTVGGDDTIWLQCRDGNYRPTHRDINPLVGAARTTKPSAGQVADGVAAGVGHRSDQSVPTVAEVQNTQEARAMRLGGYGNTINVPLTIEFITTFMER
jgi:site-specific DNA-cytosine methylase